MRNLSMKKFGTPIGAAPGMATERAGLEIVGVPSGATGSTGLVDGLLMVASGTLTIEAGTLSSYGRG